MLRQIGCESILIIRDENRKVHAFYNVCRHRGSRLCTEETGSAKSVLQCQYHAWTY
ncbi:MAG: Rieske 2Fe-2S domain-containing protein, partial [Deltaproteobacteria bacterium]|nr:Rieske 2Fe-2S domain-containing protein [Deltaproteobacteria bacterium]